MDQIYYCVTKMRIRIVVFRVYLMGLKNSCVVSRQTYFPSPI